MKTVLAIVLILGVGCQITDKQTPPDGPQIISIAQNLEAVQPYIPDLKWSEFKEKLGEDTDKTCVYHVVDFRVNAAGKVQNPKVVETTSDTFKEFSLEAARMWKFKVKDDLPPTGRLAFVYTKDDKNISYLLDPDMTFNSPKINIRSNSKPLERISTVQPQLPAMAIAGGVNGSVTIDFLVNEDGSVSDAKIISSRPQGVFDNASLKAVHQWKYKPQKVAARQKTRLDFRMDKRDSCVF